MLVPCVCLGFVFFWGFLFPFSLWSSSRNSHKCTDNNDDDDDDDGRDDFLQHIHTLKHTTHVHFSFVFLLSFVVSRRRPTNFWLFASLSSLRKTASISVPYSYSYSVQKQKQKRLRYRSSNFYQKKKWQPKNRNRRTTTNDDNTKRTTPCYWFGWPGEGEGEFEFDELILVCSFLFLFLCLKISRSNVEKLFFSFFTLRLFFFRVLFFGFSSLGAAASFQVFCLFFFCVCFQIFTLKFFFCRMKRGNFSFLEVLYNTE